MAIVATIHSCTRSDRNLDAAGNCTAPGCHYNSDEARDAAVVRGEDVYGFVPESSAWCVWALLPGPAAGWSLIAENLAEDAARVVAGALLLRTRPMPQGCPPPMES